LGCPRARLFAFFNLSYKLAEIIADDAENAVATVPRDGPGLVGMGDHIPTRVCLIEIRVALAPRYSPSAVAA
jgi:hypothetical protein